MQIPPGLRGYLLVEWTAAQDPTFRAAWCRALRAGRMADFIRQWDATAAERPGLDGALAELTLQLA